MGTLHSASKKATGTRGENESCYLIEFNHELNGYRGIDLTWTSLAVAQASGHTSGNRA